MTAHNLLEMLRARQGEWCRVAELAERLFCDPARLARAVRELRRGSYLIEAEPERGLRFAGTQDRLLPYEIRRDLGTRVVGRDVVVLESVGSTNDAAWERAAAGGVEGLTVLAEHQTRGRGRFQRRWSCPPRAGVLLSVILRPGLAPERLSALTTMAAVAVAEAIQEAFHVPALIRWPNDIVVRDAKLGGILVEGRCQDGETTFVLGLGLNVNVTADQFPKGLRRAATSLCEALGQPLDRVEVARGVLRSLDRWYDLLRAGRDAEISSHWRRYSSSLGHRLTVVENGRSYTGRVIDLSLEEGLLLRLDEGVTRVFDGARVTVDHES